MTSQRQFPCKRKAGPQEQNLTTLTTSMVSLSLSLSLSLTHTHTHAHTFILSHVRLFFTPWTAAHQAPLSMGCSRQEYWSGLPCSPPGDLPNPGIKPITFMSPALAGGFFTSSATWEAHETYLLNLF